jgi:hypothetical protein
LHANQLAYSSGWSKSTSSRYYGGEAYFTKEHDASFSRSDIVARRLYLVATECASCGTVEATWNGAVIAKIDLARSTTAHKEVLTLANFSSRRDGKLSVKVTSASSKEVVVEGVGVYDA